jgi:chromosome segregation ATPase
MRPAGERARDGDRGDARRPSEETESANATTSIVTGVEAQMDALERELSELDEKLALDRARVASTARDLEVERCLGRRLREELCEVNAQIACAKRDLAKKEREVFDFLAAANIIAPHSVEGAIPSETEEKEKQEDGVPEAPPSPVDAFAIRRAELNTALARERERSATVRSPTSRASTSLAPRRRGLAEPLSIQFGHS